MPTRLVFTLACLVFSAPAQAAAISFRLVPTGPAGIPIGGQVTIEVRATFDTRLVATSFDLSSAGTAAATVITRSANPTDPNGLTYLSSTSQDPFEDELPHGLTGGPKKEVLYDADFGGDPGGPTDGLAPGESVRIETVTVRADTAGLLTIALSAVQAAHTTAAPDGALFDQAGIGPCGGWIVIGVGGVSTEGDFDGNGSVDLTDHAAFTLCEAGPGRTPSGGNGCEDHCRRAFDDDQDSDVDLFDFARWQRQLAGP